MEKVNSGIVFSNDIYRILQGQNALDFDYTKNGLMLPTKKQISVLREDFKKDVTIFSEEKMEDFLYSSIDDCISYPHCFSR